jgi:ornithine cyclodeaminase/alanine dehydrogenase-like protein (mu-crystallin family)
MDGVSPEAGVGAVRINSDVVHWPVREGFLRREKIPAAPGGRWVGLILLFSTRTGEPLAILPDGVIQRMRVGGTSGLGAKYLARENASVGAILGSGWQAGSALMALNVVRPLAEARVYSPSSEHRQAFAEEWSEKLGVPVHVAATAHEAVRGADVVMAATNSIQPVFEGDWAEPGMHLGSVRQHELGEGVLRRAAVVAVNAHEGAPQHVLHPAVRDHPELVEGQGWTGAGSQEIRTLPLLSDVVVGRGPRRQSAEDVTVFLNNIGLGAQFAAVGAQVIERARAAGIGRELPTEWFTESVHP